MENQNTLQVPKEIKKWNWGAFMFNIFWGLGNGSYLPLLCFIPVFNLVWMFVCGAKGNQWAWKKGNYTDVETFLAVQKTWNKAGLWSFILSILFMILYFVAIFALSVSLASTMTY